MYSRWINVDMRRNENFETKPPWYVAHVWPINVCLCGRGAGDPTRRTSGYVFPGVLWLLPLLSVVSEWAPSSPAALHHIFQPPRSSHRLVPGPSRCQNLQPCCSRWRKNRQGFFFSFFWHQHIFLELWTLFLFWWSVWSGSSQKIMRHF